MHVPDKLSGGYPARVKQGDSLPESRDACTSHIACKEQ